ncbi:MAG: dehydrogenase, partial [Planctomycetes bacterium]|nr:dehydrogenase [Planctomycetota bacterium]
MNTMQRVMHTEYQKSELLADQVPPLGDGHIAGKNMCSLVSPGTEINYFYCGDTFPQSSGYASVIEVEQIADDLKGTTDINIGDHVLCMGGHASWIQCVVADAITLPQGLDPQLAVLARLMGVSHSTLVTTGARPGDRIFISGLGPVGYLAAAQFKLSGYEVYGSDPDQRVCAFAREAGIHIINENTEIESLEAMLAIDCSGHEAAVMNCAKSLRPCGELV